MKQSIVVEIKQSPVPKFFKYKKGIIKNRPFKQVGFVVYVLVILIMYQQLVMGTTQEFFRILYK